MWTLGPLVHRYFAYGIIPSSDVNACSSVIPFLPQFPSIEVKLFGLTCGYNTSVIVRHQYISDNADNRTCLWFQLEPWNGLITDAMAGWKLGCGWKEFNDRRAAEMYVVSGVYSSSVSLPTVVG